MTTENQQSELDGAGFIIGDGTPTESTGASEAPQQEAGFEPPKKRRGRPPKNPMLTEGVPSGSAKSASTARASKAKGKYTPGDLQAMAKQMVGVHMLVATMTGIPEAIISEEEGIAMASAINNIAEQYDLAIDGKTGASLQLFATAAMIYAPRALMFRKRIQEERVRSQSQVVETPTTFTQDGFTPAH